MPFLALWSMAFVPLATLVGFQVIIRLTAVPHP